MVDTCPFCGAETRQGDNFCLNCGNRLPAATPSAQNQQDSGEATQAEPQDWNVSSNAATVTASDDNWNATTPAVSNSENELAQHESSAPTAQATLDRLPEPAHFTLRSDSGEILQEYPLDKSEIAIGRAPTSDILLSKDKLTSRRHASIHFENNQYVLRDDHSANGTFINGQQLEDGVSHVLQDGDQVGIGEHELIFHAYNSPSNKVEDLPTIAVSPNSDNPDVTYRTRESIETPETDYSTRQEESMSTVPANDANDDDNATSAEASGTNDAQAAYNGVASTAQAPDAQPSLPSTPPEVVPQTSNAQNQATPPAASTSSPQTATPSTNNGYSNNNYTNTSYTENNANNKDIVSFNRFASISAPPLPDMSSLMAALSTLDGQVMSLQEQFNATQDAIRNHDTEFIQAANGLRSGIRRVSDRMDTTIAEVARSREALAWAELSQLMEDVMNNPRDIEYVTKLARKARELNKIFQIHQNVLNTMAECNSLLRSMIGEENNS